MSKVYVTPVKNTRVFVSEINGAIPNSGFYLTRTPELENYIREKLVSVKEDQKEKTTPRKRVKK